MKYILTYRLFDGADLVGRVYEDEQTAIERRDTALELGCLDVQLKRFTDEP